MEHVGGHLPFEAEVGSFLNTAKVNRITVAVNNTLGPNTLPPGTVTFHGPPQYVVHSLNLAVIVCV